mmetsp:Transcript_7596/g.16488  ORF Transcript_7596/g.16488 Transcript_7596/m.16488 type:complete len:188 (-) Transcript_7596:18-581(-)
MQKRWQREYKGNLSTADIPKRFVDKMLTNYMNIGFIHMLYPNAIILHVFRNPMDTIFSSYKHDFPAGRLDYTSDFSSLAHMYRGYRDVMEHWDKVLPGRVTHIKYEDLVHDLPGIAKKIITKLGLKWDDDILNFHKKIRATNTLSTSQVRQKVYTSSINSWKKYESHLTPLKELVGERHEYDLKTNL